MNKKGSYMKIDTSDSVCCFLSKLHFKVCILIISVCMCSGDDLWKLVLFFHHVDPREQIGRLDKKCLLPSEPSRQPALHLHFKSQLKNGVAGFNASCGWLKTLHLFRVSQWFSSLLFGIFVSSRSIHSCQWASHSLHSCWIVFVLRVCSYIRYLLKIGATPAWDGKCRLCTAGTLLLDS